MKNFKKLIKEAHLGNPLNEVNDSKTVSTKHLDAIIYEDGGIKLRINSSNKSPYGYTKRDLIKSPFGVQDEEFTFDYIKKEINEVYKNFPDEEIKELLLKVTQHKNSLNEDIQAENILKKLFGKKLDPSVIAILVDEINDIIKKKPSIKDNPEEIAKELAKDSDIDPKLLLKPRMGFIGEEPLNEDLIKEITLGGGDYSDSYGNNQAEEQLTTTEDYEIFMELFPQGEASRILMDPKRKELYDQHLEWTKENQYNNTFEHMQFHLINHDGEDYKVHQTQYYNGNYKDFRNPRFTELMISKDGKRMGTYLVDTAEYVKDLRDLESQGKLGPRVSESIKEEDRATKVDRIFAGDIEIPEFDPEDVLADLEREKNEEFSSTEQKMINQIKSYKKRGSAMINLPYDVRKFYFDNRKKIDALNEGKYFSLEKGDKLKVPHPIYKNLTLTITNPKGSGYEYYSKHDEGGVEKGWAEAGYFSSAIEKGDAELIKAIKEDMNDPVLVRARAAKMADEKEKAKQSSLNKKYGSTFMDKLDAELDLKAELQDLKDEREQLMIDMEQEAEPEGGEIADRYGSRLNDIDARMAAIKSELDDLRMYESVNEGEYRIEYEDEDDNRNYIKIKASSEEEAEQKSSGLDGFRTLKSIELVDEGTCGYTPDGEPRSKPAGPDLNEDDELNVNIDNANDNYAKSIDAESRSGAYESLQKSLREKLQERLK